jgi:hypothetical protein
VQQLVLDPEGEYHTLRERFDYILAAPKGGDTVAHPKTAKLLAERLLQLGVSAILDIYELNPDHRQAFVRHFLQALVDAPRELWHPTLVILDEAHVYAPEGKESDEHRGGEGDGVARAEARVLPGAGDPAPGEALEGRRRGVQQQADWPLHPRRRHQAGGRGARVHDRTSRSSACGSSSLGSSTRTAPRSTSTEPRLVKVGRIATTHPEPGQQAAPVPPPTEKVKKVLQQLADLPAEAEAREKSLADLKAENASLKRQLIK